MKNLIKIKSIMALLLTFVMMFGVVTAFADTFVPPKPFEIWSEDGTKVFRWNPGPDDNWSRGVAQAGVYQNDELVYSVENLPIIGESASNFIFSDDLRYMVFRPTVSQTIAFGFFENGVLLRVYRIDELVRNMNVVTYSVTTASWENWNERNFDASNNTLTIVTRDDITYVFDITTGEIIYDTVGDTPFIPHEEDSFGFFIGEGTLPLWAQASNNGRTFSLTQTSNNEIPSPWAKSSIERARDLGLLPEAFRSGFGRNTTRAEFAAIAVTLYEHFRGPITGRNTFSDTSDINVEKAAYLGIVTGVGNNHFAPGSPITREQAAVMLSRLASVLDSLLPVSTPHFADNDDISSWAAMAVGAVQQSQIMSGVGDNRFAPQQLYTREQSVVTIMRVFDLLNREESNVVVERGGLSYRLFVDLLVEGGFAVKEVYTNVADPYWLSVGSRVIGIDGEIIAVYEYDSNEAMLRDSGFINPGGLSIERPDPTNEENIIDVKISWEFRPYWFKSDLIIVRYVGENESIINFLKGVFGETFV